MVAIRAFPRAQTLPVVLLLVYILALPAIHARHHTSHARAWQRHLETVTHPKPTRSLNGILDDLVLGGKNETLGGKLPIDFCPLFDAALKLEGALNNVIRQLSSAAWDQITAPKTGILRDPLPLDNLKLPVQGNYEVVPRRCVGRICTPAQTADIAGTITLHTLQGLRSLGGLSIHIHKSSCENNNIAGDLQLVVHAGSMSLNSTFKGNVTALGIKLPDLTADIQVGYTNLTLTLITGLNATLDLQTTGTCRQVLTVESVDIAHAAAGVTISVPKEYQFLVSLLQGVLNAEITRQTSQLENSIKTELSTVFQKIQQCS